MQAYKHAHTDWPQNNNVIIKSQFMLSLQKNVNVSINL